MPPRLRKKTAVAKRRVSIRATSCLNVEVGSSPNPTPPTVEEPTAAAKTDSGLEKDETGKSDSDPIVAVESAIESIKDGECSQPDPVILAPSEKKATACVVKKEAENGGTVEEPVEEERVDGNAGGEKEMVREGEMKTVEEEEEGENIEQTIGANKEVEEKPDKEEVQDDGGNIEKCETEEVANGGEIEQQPAEEEELVEGGELVEQEPVEVEEEPVEDEEEPVEDDQEPVEDGEEEEASEEEPMEVEEEPMEEEEDEEEPMEEEEDEDEPMEEEEDEDDEQEEEEEPVEEELGKKGGKEEFAQGRSNEHKRDLVAVKVQSASVDLEGEGGENEDQGLGDMPESSMYMKALLPNRKVKETRIFISQLEKSVVEEDIAKVFARFGEIQSVEVFRHSLTQKSKGFAYLQYYTAEAVEKALSQLKDGAEINGKIVHISASNQENCTLFVGNICKSWSKDQVLDALNGLGVEGIEQLVLPEDPKVEGRIKGFAFVELFTHLDAKAALNRLSKPDAVLGCDFSAKVSFAQFPVNQNEEVLAKVKSVYLEPIPTSWDGKKIEDICNRYGAIEKIKLYRKSKSRKKKDFAFVEFVSRESALSCVEGLNRTLIGHGDTKVSASIARPYAKTGTKFVMRGNFKVEKEAKINKSSNEKVEKAEVKIIEVSGESKRKRRKSKLKDVLTQKSNNLSPQKIMKKNKNVNKKVPGVEIPKEAPQRHAPKKKPNKETAVSVRPQGSRKRPFKEAPESSRRLSKGRMELEKGMRGGPHAHKSGTKKQKPIKGSKQRQRGGPAVNSERAFKRPRNDHHGARRLTAEYAYAPPPYAGNIHVPPPYASRAHEPSRPEAPYTSRAQEASRYELPYTSRAQEPSRLEPPYTSRTHEPIRHEPYAYASGSYLPHHSDLAPHARYITPPQHAPRTRHVYEMSAPAPYDRAIAPYDGGYDRAIAPYDGGYDRAIAYNRGAIAYTREPPPVPPASHPGYVTYPGYQQPSYPYPSGGSYPADYAPRRLYY